MKKALRICLILIVIPLVVPIAVVGAAVAAFVAMGMMSIPLVGFVLTDKWSWPWE